MQGIVFTIYFILTNPPCLSTVIPSIRVIGRDEMQSLHSRKAIPVISFRAFRPRRPIQSTDVFSRLPCTHWAAAPRTARPGIDSCFPYMSFRTNPPDPFAASCRHLLRCQTAIEHRVPLSCYFRCKGRQIVEARKHFSPSTIGAAAAMHSTGRYRCRIRMSLFTNPPYCSIAVWRDLFWGQLAILSRMPLAGNLRKPAAQIVFSCTDQFARADRTACSIFRPGNYGCAPLMSPFADPPYRSMRPCHHLTRRQIAVLSGMPLDCQFRMRGSQIIYSFFHHAVCADRAAVARGSGFDSGLPFMSFFTLPPTHPVAATAHVSWRQRYIFCCIPLLKQSGFPSAHTELLQCLPHLPMPPRLMFHPAIGCTMLQRVFCI